MKQTRFLLFALFILVAETTFSQQISIYWGKEVETNRHNSLKKVIGQTDQNLLLLQQIKAGGFAKPKLALTEFSLVGLNFKSTQNITVKGLGAQQDYENMLVVDGHLYLFTSIYDKAVKKNLAYAQEFDGDGKFIGDPHKLDEIKTDSKSNRGSYGVYLSNDSSKILVVNNPPFFKYAGEKFNFKVLDGDLKVLSNKEVQLPYKDKKFSAYDYELADDGTVYMLAKIDKERDEKEKGQADFYYEIISVSPSAKGEVNEFELKLDQRKITDIAFRQNKQGTNLLCAGFYTDVKGKAAGELKGTFFININTSTRKMEAQSTKEFDQDFIEELTTRRRAANGHGLDGTFDLKNFLIRDDGSALVIAENSYDYAQTTTTYSSSGGYSSSTHYHYVRNNIIAINISSQGAILWNANIAKKQHTVDDGGIFCSYIVSEFNNKTYFIFNDHKKNLMIQDPKKYKTMRRPRVGVSTLVEVDNKGKSERVVLQNNKDSKFVVMPRFYQKLSDKELLLYAYKPVPLSCCFIDFGKAKYKLGRLTF